MTGLELLPPPLIQYEGQTADVSIASMPGWHTCTILAPDERLKDHLWVRDEEGNEHIVHALLVNFVFST